MKVKIINVSNNPLPKYANFGDSGMDLYAHLESDLVINPGDRALVSTGIKVALPEGYEFQVRPRSGLALKKGITVLNTPGTVDSKENFNFKYITN